MSRSIRSYPVEQQPMVIARRLHTYGIPDQMGLGLCAAIDFAGRPERQQRPTKREASVAKTVAKPNLG